MKAPTCDSVLTDHVAPRVVRAREAPVAHGALRVAAGAASGLLLAASSPVRSRLLVPPRRRHHELLGVLQVEGHDLVLPQHLDVHDS